MEYYKTEEDGLVAVPDQVHKLISEFSSYLSYDSDQDAATTTTHLDNMMVELMCNSMIPTLYISMKCDIVIDHAVGSPVHGKDIVDRLNAVDKAYLNKMVFRMYNSGSKWLGLAKCEEIS
eukprot:15243934-Ditylum_brightwellii.AAC.1